MEKKHIITIAGKPGSGKSTTSDRIAEILGYSRFSSGDFMRAIAEKRGVSIEELNKIAETETTIDHGIDEALRNIRDNDLLVIDSRLAFHWIPESFKVYLELDITAAAKRVWTDIHEQRLSSSERTNSLAEVKKHIVARQKSEKKRYKALYDLDPYAHEHFDMVIDTTNTTPDTVADQVVKAYRAWLEVK